MQDGIDDGSEVSAIESLIHMFAADAGLASSVLSLGWVQDGMDDEAEVRSVALLEETGWDDTELDTSIVSLGWVQDGIDNETEVSAIELLSLIGNKDGRLASSIVSLGWVRDGVDEDSEVSTIGLLGNFAGTSTDLALYVVSLAWVQDGIVKDAEFDVIRGLGSIAAWDVPLASSIVSLGWVQDGINTLESRALGQVARIARGVCNYAPDGSEICSNNVPLASSVLSLGWVQDGIYNDAEVNNIGFFEYFAGTDAGLALSVLSLRWVQDGIDNDAEVNVLEDVSSIRDGTLASTVMSLNWVQDGIDPLESKALGLVAQIPRGACNFDLDRGLVCLDNAGLASSVVSLGWVEDGIDNYAEVSVIAALEYIGGKNAELASSVVSLVWVQDGLDSQEAEVLDRARYDVISNPLILRVFSLGWVQDGISSLEAEVLDWARLISNPFILRVFSLGWVQDGIDNEEEVDTIRYLYLIAEKDATLGESVISLGWVQDGTDNDVEVNTMLSLLLIAQEDAPLAESVVSLGWVQDGIDDDVEATLWAIVGRNPGFINVLLDPGRLMVEQRTITLPLARDVLLAIIRTGPGATRSMDLLEHSVRTIEAFMEAPFPTRYVGLLYDDDAFGFGGTYHGTHIAILARYDLGDSDHDSEVGASILAHEVGHYYWNSNVSWIDEGLAQTMVRLVERDRVGSPVEPRYVPCPYVRTIAELEALAPKPGDEEFHCNSLGEGLFLDLYGTLGKAKFFQGASELYAMSVVQPVGIAEVREAFGAEGGPAMAVIDRWYHGTES